MRRILLVVGVAFAATLVSTPALGTPPGRNGQIVYARFPTLWIANTDGSGARKLPWVKRSATDNPDWSPDGRRIAFDRCAAKCEIWTIDADGTNQKRIGPDCLGRLARARTGSPPPGRPTES